MGRVRQQSETLFMCQENQAPLSGRLPKENKLAQLLGQRGRELGREREKVAKSAEEVTKQGSQMTPI